MGIQWKQWLTLFFFSAPKSLQMVIAAMKLKDTYSLEEKLWPTSTAYSKTETLLCRPDPYSQSYWIFCSHVWMWELDHKEGWALKNWCFWTVLLEKTLESPLDSKEIKPVIPKGNWSWIFIGRTDAEAEAPILYCKEPTHLERPWCWEILRARGEEGDRRWDDWMASPTWSTRGWRSPGVDDGQGSSSWDHKELDKTDQWTELNAFFSICLLPRKLHLHKYIHINV